MDFFIFYRASFFLINLICGLASIWLLKFTYQKSSNTIFINLGIFCYMLITVLSFILSYLIFMPHGYYGYELAIYILLVVLFVLNITVALFILQFFYSWRFVGSERTSNALCCVEGVILGLFLMSLFISLEMALSLLILNLPLVFISEICLEINYTRHVNRMLHTIGYDLDNMLQAKDLVEAMVKTKVILLSTSIPGLYLFFYGESILEWGVAWVLFTLCLVIGTVVIDKKVDFLKYIQNIKKEEYDMEFDHHVLQSVELDNE
eukprot:NODE_299_length_10456_cov_1.003669.p3 type:complete len:263 gc:universal NODE_299_length_10456_cov_1.003669:5291-4503(-)